MRLDRDGIERLAKTMQPGQRLWVYFGDFCKAYPPNMVWARESQFLASVDPGRRLGMTCELDVRTGDFRIDCRRTPHPSNGTGPKGEPNDAH